MSDTEWTTRPSSSGVRAVFGNDAALQDALAHLALQGFDRADLTVPSRDAPALAAAPPPATSMAGVAGAGPAGLVNPGGTRVVGAGEESRERAARVGELVLLVRARTSELRDRAKPALGQAGAGEIVELFPERVDPPRDEPAADRPPG